MRKLKTSDIPAFCRCLKAMGIKEKVREISQNSDTAQDAWNRGFDLIWNIFDLATEVNGEQELYKFLANPFEMTAEEIADMPIPDFFALMKQLAEENDLKSFFSFAAKSMKSN